MDTTKKHHTTNGVSIPENYGFEDVPAIQPGHTPEHSELLNKLLETVQPIDFREVAGIEDDENLTNRHFIVYAVKEILSLARSMEWGICQHNSFVYLFNGAYWAKIDDDGLKRFLGEAAKKLGWPEAFSDFYQHRDHLLKQFKSEAYLPAPVRDPEKVLINLQNGTLEISNDGVNLRDFDSADFLTHQLPFNYDPEAEAPRFQQYLKDVLPDDGLQKILGEYSGYIFIPTGALKLEKVLMLYGAGANGKSVFFDILRALVGNDNFSTYSLQSLTNDNGYYRADLADRLVNYASEISGRIESSYFKTLASGEPIEARLPYREPIVISDYARLIFNVNQLPADVEHTEGFFRRFLIIPFDQHIPEEKQEKGLAKSIINEELPGILNWAIAGLNRLLSQGGFSHSPKVDEAVNKYRKESDSVALFVDDYGLQPSITDYKPLKELYQKYRQYALDNGYRPVSNINFGKRLDSLSFERDKTNAGQVVYTETETPFP